MRVCACPPQWPQSCGDCSWGTKCPISPFFPDLHRCAVFCLLQIGTEIYDTEMVLVDRTLADICFETSVLL